MNKKIVDFYNNDSKKYEFERFSSMAGKYSDQVHKEIVLGFNDSWKNKRILDVCCGTGRFSIEVAKKGATVTSLDFSREMLNILNQTAGALQLSKNIHPLQTDVHKMMFKDDTFDGCICITAIQLINDYVSVIQEISRVLKPNGFLIMNFPNLLGWYFPIGMYVNMTEKSIQKDVHSKWFTIGEIRAAFTNAGLEITDINGYICFPANTPRPIFEVLRKADKISRASILKYLSASLFVKGVKLEEDL